ncbi:hypothetical protein [Amycolatopsis kentuckyensis]|uniref:hypothetical protein n=1 Tax=Amycolatopsis kentuckyensis TaxID=218823 RepID=UPI0035628AA7
MSQVLEFLNHVVARTAVTSGPGAIGTKSGFSSAPPINLDALELRDLLWDGLPLGGEYLELEAKAMRMIENPTMVPLGLCPCGQPVACEFDRVAGQCEHCGEWLSRAESVHAAREYVESTWLTPAEIERETREWGSPVKATRVRQWRCRGQITPDEHGRYRLADVLEQIDVTTAV